MQNPDRNGEWADVLLGFETASEYATAGGSFGALLGRTSNRLARGRITIDGRTYELSKNEDGSTLHGGMVGFDKVLWQAEQPDGATLHLFHVSPDGDQGFPGTLRVSATYQIAQDVLQLSFEASTDAPTPVSLSAHPYFNLSWPFSPDIFSHVVTIPSDCFLETDSKQIPTGIIRPVDATAFDFRSPSTVGSRIRQFDEQLRVGKGYDHYYILPPSSAGRDRVAARVADPRSGRILEIRTSQRGLQFYSGNNLTGAVHGRGGMFRQSSALALEPQAFPNAPNEPRFPSSILRPGENYRETIAYRLFTVLEESKPST